MTTSVGFWGRSVGAVVAVTVAGSEPFRKRIGGLVLDSPYSSLRAMIDDLAEFYIPKVRVHPRIEGGAQVVRYPHGSREVQ
jgi:hypothetical protein